MPPRTEAYGNCRFYVDLGDNIKAVFSAVEGLQVENATFEVEEGGTNSFVRRLPGGARVGNLTLKRGLTTGNELFKWLAGVSSGKTRRRNIAVVIFDARGAELARFSFRNVFPVKWVGPSLAADGGQAAIETLELAHEGLEGIGE